MIEYENECCDCAVPGYPCLGKDCPNIRVPHYYCDQHKEEAELYYYDGEQLCLDCIIGRLEKVVAED